MNYDRTLALVALVFLLSTCAFFAYVILLPAQGVTPNVSMLPEQVVQPAQTYADDCRCTCSTQIGIAILISAA